MGLNPSEEFADDIARITLECKYILRYWIVNHILNTYKQYIGIKRGIK